MQYLRMLVVSLLILWFVGPAFSQASNPGNAVFPANGLTNSVITVKAVPGVAAVLRCANQSSGWAYVQFFDTTGSVTLGVTVPKYSIPFATGKANDAIMNVNFTAGIKIAATSTPAGSGAPDQVLNCSLVFE
jgi:hypothetical protein